MKDLIVVGGGIVGLATSYRFLQRFPDTKLLLFEKEEQLGMHQTGNNSGVLHSGIYHKPGSLKASNCRVGKRAMEEFCQEHDVAFDICGKVIVALDESELPGLQKIYERGQANGVGCEIIGKERLREIEPHAAGIQAIHVPEAGIVDYRQVALRLGELIESAGGKIHCGCEVTGISDGTNETVVQTTGGTFPARVVVNCAGLHSDRVVRMTGLLPEAQIVPFRGEYYELKPAQHHLCRHLIYPVPDPSFPFLGVHFTRMIGGGVECGPNAVLAFAREGYTKSDVRLGDLFESLAYPGFRRLALKHWRTGLGEMWRSFSKDAFVTALQRLMPEIRKEHLTVAPAGVRAMALKRSGVLVDDFLIQERGRVVHVENAPSPAATASLNIGNLVADRLEALRVSD